MFLINCLHRKRLKLCNGQQSSIKKFSGAHIIMLQDWFDGIIISLISLKFCPIYTNLKSEEGEKKEIAKGD